MKKSEIMDLLEEKTLESEPGTFASIEHAIIIAASAIQYLADQCDDEEDKDDEG